ncbi:hypothetical protein [Chryseobacterium sp. MFBS3-17]|uniref:hypothetical protein n=1 Tax=Chryseobacterium sp. MFBS3-17 TaxID=2886689 RepID=UPI001D0E3D49|nr:hypothetical protein [Chryseobacterium sp. MFBS3-17]MCC2589466.1 hypothetical protein [Chryseobacterium sp. MFBS3-17]
MKRINKLLLFGLMLALFTGCKKEQENLSLEQVKYNSNTTSYPSAKMDTLQSINKITRQKVREVLELSILYNSGNKDTEIDAAMYNQILGYFYKPDSTTVKSLFTELDSLKVKNSRINSFEVLDRYYKEDTLNYAKFQVEYFNQANQSLGKFDREAQYILVPAEIQFKKEFKFFFLNFYEKPLNDTISSGVTR